MTTLIGDQASTTIGEVDDQAILQRWVMVEVRK